MNKENTLLLFETKYVRNCIIFLRSIVFSLHRLMIIIHVNTQSLDKSQIPDSNRKNDHQNGREKNITIYFQRNLNFVITL